MEGDDFIDNEDDSLFLAISERMDDLDDNKPGKEHSQMCLWRIENLPGGRACGFRIGHGTAGQWYTSSQLQPHAAESGATYREIVYD